MGPTTSSLQSWCCSCSIAGAVIVIGQRSITDWITAALALATTAVLWRFKKIPEPAVVAVAAVIGLIVHPLVAHA